MGVKHWGARLIVAVLVSAVGASGAPIVQAAETPALVPAALAAPSAKPAPLDWADVVDQADLPASLADTNVANTPHAKPDTLTNHWPCALPIRIYYTAAPSVDSRTVVHQLEYPVEYLRDLGYKVTIVREVAYQTDYQTPRTIGDVLLVAPTNDAQTQRLRGHNWLAITDPMAGGHYLTSAKITVDGERGLTSAVLLHEFGHVLGLPHKDGSVMGVGDTSSLAYDPAETAAVDCR